MQQGFRNGADERLAHKDLMAYAKTCCSSAVFSYLFKNRARLSNLIDDIWAWENVEADLATARLTRLEASPILPILAK